jgi:cell division protein FtsZ
MNESTEHAPTETTGAAPVAQAAVQPAQPIAAADAGPAIRIIGLGNAGAAVVALVAERAAPGFRCAVVDTDVASLETSKVPEKILLKTIAASEPASGNGSDPARAQPEENLSSLKGLCAGAGTVFFVAGLGGAAGSTLAPLAVRAAKDAGALALAFVTLPSTWEGNHRRQRALSAFEELGTVADGVICLPNDVSQKLNDDNTRFADMFKIPNSLMAEGVCSMARLMVHKGLIELRPADICALLHVGQGESCFATAEAAGPTRSRDVMDKLLAHPMLEGGRVLAECRTLLVSLVGGPDLSLAEVNRVMDQINNQCGLARVIMGAAIDANFTERLAVTVVAARGGDPAGDLEETNGAGAARNGHRPEPLSAQLLDRAGTARPHSRFVPPAPALPPEKLRQLAGRQKGGGRESRAASKMRQAQLPLEIISKGRFDKSEPTIHKGEDLDVPTYIRRGVSLN